MKVVYSENGVLHTETHNNVKEAYVEDTILHVIGQYEQNRHYNWDKVVWYGTR